LTKAKLVSSAGLVPGMAAVKTGLGDLTDQRLTLPGLSALFEK
jgi:hypothetical protein